MTDPLTIAFTLDGDVIKSEHGEIMLEIATGILPVRDSGSNAAAEKSDVRVKACFASRNRRIFDPTLSVRTNHEAKDSR
jgi:hypothetical protein